MTTSYRRVFGSRRCLTRHYTFDEFRFSGSSTSWTETTREQKVHGPRTCCRSFTGCAECAERCRLNLATQHVCNTEGNDIWTMRREPLFCGVARGMLPGIVATAGQELRRACVTLRTSLVGPANATLHPIQQDPSGCSVNVCDAEHAVAFLEHTVKPRFALDCLTTAWHTLCHVEVFRVVVYSRWESALLPPDTLVIRRRGQDAAISNFVALEFMNTPSLWPCLPSADNTRRRRAH